MELTIITEAVSLISNNTPLVHCVTVNTIDCDWYPLEDMKYLFTCIFFYFLPLESRQSAVLSSATQQAIPSELGGK